MSQWHIARILHKSNLKYHTQQAVTNVDCIAWIAKGSKVFLLQHIMIERNNIVATRKLSWTSSFALMTLSII